MTKNTDTSDPFFLLKLCTLVLNYLKNNNAQICIFISVNLYRLFQHQYGCTQNNGALYVKL